MVQKILIDPNNNVYYVRTRYRNTEILSKNKYVHGSKNINYVCIHTHVRTYMLER